MSLKKQKEKHNNFHGMIKSAKTYQRRKLSWFNNSIQQKEKKENI